jgi:hypothetical protein
MSVFQLVGTSGKTKNLRCWSAEKSLQHPVSARYGARADDQILPAIEDSVLTC